MQSLLSGTRSQKGSTKYHESQNSTLTVFRQKYFKSQQFMKLDENHISTFAFSRPASFCCPPCSASDPVVLAGVCLVNSVFMDFRMYWFQLIQNLEIYLDILYELTQSAMLLNHIFRLVWNIKGQIFLNRIKSWCSAVNAFDNIWNWQGK